MSEQGQDPTVGAEAEVATTLTGAGEAPQVAQQDMQYIEETGRWTYTDAEGISFEYDENLKAWFPMVRHTSNA